MEIINCAIYVRVSTDKQESSIENQVTQGTEYVTRLLGEMYRVSEDAIYVDEAQSGYYTSVFDRPAMQRAMADAKNKRFKVIVFKEISRVGRDKQENPAIVGMFEQFGVRVIAINDNYDSNNKDNITFDILSVLAEQESKKTSVRVSSAKKQKAIRGLWNTDAPIGYSYDSKTKKLYIDEESKDIVQTIFDLYTNDGLGSFKIAEHLNNTEKQTRDGNMFSREAIKRIIRNEAYIGNTVYGKRRNELKREYDDTGKMTKKKVSRKIESSEWTRVEGTHEPIISKEQFYLAQSILNERGHHRTPRRAYHPLTGILVCLKCGQGMVCQKRKYKDKDYRYYICKTYHKYGRSVCTQANVNADKLEEYVFQVVNEKISRLDKSKLKGRGSQKQSIDKLQKELKKKEKDRDKLQKDQIDIFQQRELFTENMYKEQMMTIKKKIETVEEERENLEQQVKALMEESNDTERFISIITEFSAIDVENKEKLRVGLHELIEKISLNEKHVIIESYYDILS